MSDKNIDRQKEVSHYETFNRAVTALVQSVIPSFCAGYDANKSPNTPRVK